MLCIPLRVMAWVPPKPTLRQGPGCRCFTCDVSQWRSEAEGRGASAGTATGPLISSNWGSVSLSQGGVGPEAASCSGKSAQAENQRVQTTQVGFPQCIKL